MPEIVLCPSLFFSRQVGRYGPESFDFSADRVTASVSESLERLQVDYIDVIQTHDIEFGDLDQVSPCARYFSSAPSASL